MPWNEFSGKSVTFYDPLFDRENNQATGAFREFPRFSSRINTVGDQLPHGQTIDLSVIIPFNDTVTPNQLSNYLREVAEYLQDRQNRFESFKYECTLVDDDTSSSQYTQAVSFVSELGADKFRLLRFPQPFGEGAAVRLGIRGCRGKFILIAPPDSGVAFGQLKTMESSMFKHRIGLLIGSRSNFSLSNSLNSLALGYPCGAQIDFECPFRLMDRAVALHLSESMASLSSAYLIEMIAIAKSCGIPTHWVKTGTPFHASLNDTLSIVQYLESYMWKSLRFVGLL